MIRMRYRCKIVEAGNQPFQGRIDRQYGQLMHIVCDIYRVFYKTN